MIRHRWACIAFFFVFFVVSLVYIDPYISKAETEKEKNRKSDNSSALVMKTIAENDRVISRFEDEEGNLTYADDLRYAFKTVTKTPTGEYEAYFDEQGKPAKNTSGYYGVLREYDEKEKTEKITYLGENNQIIMTVEGFAIICRKYNESGIVIVDLFFDERGEPVCTSSYGYGKQFEYYEDGRIRMITYLNSTEEPMMTGLGYASVIRQYYPENDPHGGKVKYEFYYDENGDPVSALLGEYVIKYEYDTNGNIAVITYLGADGNQIINSAGYASIKRTYLQNNYIATEQYYDIDGNPVALARGEYGIRRDTPGKIIFLDQKGETKFNVKYLLYNNPRLVILASLVIVIFSAISEKRINLFLMIFYIICIIYMTLLYRETDSTSKRLAFFRSYSQLLSNAGIRAGIIKNIWLFIPIGTVIFKLFQQKSAIFIAFAISILIELLQYWLKNGFFEPDDIISNSLGGIIGFYAGRSLTELKKTFQSRLKRSRVYTLSATSSKHES